MSTYCKLIEHNKDNKRVYKRCSVTNDKSLDSDGCTYDNEKKRCYTRKKTKQKKQGQKLTKRKAVQKKPTSIKTQIETTNKEKHLIREPSARCQPTTLNRRSWGGLRRRRSVADHGERLWICNYLPRSKPE